MIDMDIGDPPPPPGSTEGDGDVTLEFIGMLEGPRGMFGNHPRRDPARGDGESAGESFRYWMKHCRAWLENPERILRHRLTGL